LGFSNAADFSEEQLLALAKAGDEQAFSLLVERCETMIRSQAIRLRTPRLESEDLVQEGLLGLLSAVRTYQPAGGASFSTYASVCVRNRMMSAIRRRSGEQQEFPVEDAVLDGEIGGAAQDPAVMMAERENYEHLLDQLRTLLTKLEYDVLMRYLNGDAYETIAAALQTDTKAVDNALQRVRRKLTKRYFSAGGQ
jgi:RNA polymerase sporulation-specific sigma factor